MSRPRNPAPTVDAIIELPGDRVVLIERGSAPFGWAFPGGFVDYGETAEAACAREAREETGLEVRLVALLGVYSDPARDPRQHTMSVVYVCDASGEPVAGDDAREAHAVPVDALLDRPFAFDHAQMARDFLAWRSLRPAR
jgi:8-oxo-dGTP diphosphatase